MEEENKIIVSIDPVNIQGTKKILNQLINCICKIKIKEEYTTGFFCKIPFKNETIKVFITNYHFLIEKNLKENKKLILLLNNEKEAIKIDLFIERKVYLNKEYDITIIELKDEDKIKDYLELDDNLFKDNSEIIYKNKSIYTLHYQNGKNACVSYGLLNNKDKYNIMHNCSTDNGSFGSPILNLQNNKVIGIHNQNSIKYNIGTLLNLPIIDFINKNFMEEEKDLIIINNKNFKIIKKLGEGGFGKVIQVLNKSDNKYYAIKQIPIKEEKEEKIEEILNEAKILSKFNCNNIVKYYDCYKDNNNIYILIEYCKEGNLKSFIKKYIDNNTLIEEKIISNIIKQICIGIKEIHNKKIVHRDLKPENIFINDNMNIKIGDFGISKQLNSYQTHALTKNKTMSEYYVSPEIKIKGIYNEKADIYSLGCIIYELFTLNIYYNDLIMNDIKKINSDLYNNKWQKLMDSLLQIDYKKRFDINQVNKFLEDELNIKDSIENKIIGEIHIKKEDINKDIRIINSFENVKRELKLKDDDDFKYLNEKEIKENIEIKINGKIIEFTYYYKFNKEGKNIIEYSFKNILTKACFMFYDCISLINLDFSKFNTQNVINMSYMFYNCYSLISLDLSKFNTQKVNDMSYMFYQCKSLKSLDLSNFNTQNVTKMNSMFMSCNSLISLDLSNFNTQNVINMSHMFFDCKSLTNLNLSNFNTQNVTNMRCMFSYCNSLTNLNLSNFNTQNVTDMNGMFYECKSLNKKNLITKKVLKPFPKHKI